MFQEFMKGFKITKEMCIISNLKKLFIELSKNEEHAQTFQQAMLFIPITTLELSADLNIEFEDAEDLEQNEMARASLA